MCQVWVKSIKSNAFCIGFLVVLHMRSASKPKIMSKVNGMRAVSNVLCSDCRGVYVAVENSLVKERWWCIHMYSYPRAGEARWVPYLPNRSCVFNHKTNISYTVWELRMLLGAKIITMWQITECLLECIRKRRQKDLLLHPRETTTIRKTDFLLNPREDRF